MQTKYCNKQWLSGSNSLKNIYYLYSISHITQKYNWGLAAIVRLNICCHLYEASLLCTLTTTHRGLWTLLNLSANRYKTGSIRSNSIQGGLTYVESLNRKTNHLENDNCFLELASFHFYG